MTNNPFQLLNNKQKLTVLYIIEDLNDQDLINYFEQLIYTSFPKETIKNDLKSLVDTIIETIKTELPLIQIGGIYHINSKEECFKQRYDELYNSLEIF